MDVAKLMQAVRTYDVTPTRVAVPDATVTTLTPADGNIIGVSIAAIQTAAWVAGTGIVIGPLVNGLVVPLATLAAGFPCIYLHAERYGSAIMGGLSALGNLGAAATLGVTVVRVTNPNPVL